MTVTTTQLRKDIYRIIDRVARTGASVTVISKGQSVILSSARAVSRLTRLKKRNILNCNPQDIVHTDWFKEWKPSI